MRKKEQEITSRSEINDIIAKCEICRIALSDNDMPYIVPVNFGINGNDLYIHCATEGRKIDIIKKNPNVCVEFDINSKIAEAEKACNWSIKYKSVIAIGKACIIDNFDEKIIALNILMSQYSDENFTFNEDSVNRTAIIKISLSEITGKQSGY